MPSLITQSQFHVFSQSLTSVCLIPSFPLVSNSLSAFSAWRKWTWIVAAESIDDAEVFICYLTQQSQEHCRDPVKSLN